MKRSEKLFLSLYIMNIAALIHETNQYWQAFYFIFSLVWAGLFILGLDKS